MGKTKVYRECADGKSGDVRSIKADLRSFKYDNEILDARILPNVDGEYIDLFADEFCSLCWRRTEERTMKIRMAKVVEDTYKEIQAQLRGQVSEKYFAEVSSLNYDFNHILEHVDDATFNVALPIITELTNAYNIAIKQPTKDNKFEFQCLLHKHAPNYIPQAVLPGKMWLIDFMELKLRVLEHLFVLRWAEDKIITLSATNRRPSARFCSEHDQLNQQNNGKSRRLYQRDIKHKKEFHSKVFEVLKRQGIVKECDGWIETIPVSIDNIERIRKEAYDSLDRRELIIKMHADGKRQCEIVKGLIERNQLNPKTGRQVVSNVLRREKKKQDTIDEIKKQKSNGVPEPEIAKKLKISKHTVTRLLDA